MVNPTYRILAKENWLNLNKLVSAAIIPLGWFP